MTTQKQQSLSEWLSYIESTHPSEIELGLTRLQQVAERLDVAPTRSKVVTIGGTNGKGTCAALLSAMLEGAGYRTATYTSPHLVDFKERLLVDGEKLSDSAWCSAFSAVEQARGETRLTYFEFVTLAAFYLASQANLDYWVLEVGLGGRLDAVNLIDADCAIITSVSLDHQEWLGDTVAKIAREKAGIARDNRPIIAASNKVAELIKDHIGEALLTVSESQPISAELQHFLEQYADQYHSLSLRAAHSAFIKMTHLTPEYEGLSERIRLQARWSKPLTDVSIWVDVAHNPEAIANLAAKMKYHAEIDRWVAICGMLKDKDAEAALKMLVGHIDEWCLVATDGHRGQSAENLLQRVAPFGLSNASTDEQLEHAIEQWQSKIASGSQSTGVIIFGSFDTASRAIRYFDGMDG